MAGLTSDEIQRLKLEVNEIRGVFYTGAERILGVDITGIPLPHRDPTVTGGFQTPSQNHGGEYDFLSPTAYDVQLNAQHQDAPADDTPKPQPKIYHAMGTFLYRAVTILEARQAIADGEVVSGFDSQKASLARALEEVKTAARVPPFAGAREFVDQTVRMAETVYALTMSDKVMTREVAEMGIQTRRGGL